MSNNVQNVPRIRFPGFSDAWEQRKLIEVCDYVDYRGKTPVKTDSGIFLVTAKNVKNGYIDYEVSQEYISEDDYEQTMHRGIPEIGDVLITTEAPCGNVAQVDKPNIALAQRIIKYRGHKEVVDNTFLKQYFLSPIFQRLLVEKSTGGTVQGIKGSVLHQLPIMVPSIQEQYIIGELLDCLDNTITLHQRKCEDLKTLKQGMLQKMFPKDGADVPEIRFPGFTDAWEQRKFSEFTFDAGTRNKDNRDLEPYAVTNDRGFIPQSEAHDEFGYMQNTDRTAYNIVKPNSFAYNPARINVGSIGYYAGENDVIVSSLYEVFQTADYVDDRFLWHWLKSENLPKWIGRLQEGSVRLYFYYDKLCECHMMMPSLEEQKLIAEFLDNLDNTITLHQRKCDELKEMKKALLQQMFI